MFPMSHNTALSDEWGEVSALWVLSVSHPLTALLVTQNAPVEVEALLRILRPIIQTM